MALVINKDECIGCGSCASTCPVGAIKEADGKYEIGDECVECGACVLLNNLDFKFLGLQGPL